MQNKKKRRTSGGPLLLALAALLSGCGSLPDIEDARTIELRTTFGATWAPEVDVDGNPNLRPGAMALSGLEASMEACQEFFIFCAVISVPVYTVTGAVVTAVDTLPEEEAEMLNLLTARATSGLPMSRMFNSVMLSEAIRQGVQVQASGAEAIIEFVATELWWEVSIGNQVSLRLTVEAHARHSGKTGRRRFGYRGKPAPIEEWLAGGEPHIRDSLEAFLPEASEAIWQRILDRD
jgi:hypothetical protein